MDTIKLTTDIIDGKPQVEMMLIHKKTLEDRIATILTMAKVTALEHNKPLAIFSLELSNTRLLAHLLADSPKYDVVEALESKHSNGQLQQTLDDIKGKPLYMDDSPALSVRELKEKASKLVKEHGVQVILIDSFELLDACDMDSLKTMAQELGVLLLVLSQKEPISL